MERLKKLAEVAILLPIAHIIACVIFLAGYVMLFGGNVSSLFAVSDSFSITLGNVFQIYAITLVIPLLSQWYDYARDEKRVKSTAALPVSTGEQPKVAINTPIRDVSKWKRLITVTRPWWLPTLLIMMASRSLYLRIYWHEQILFALLIQSIQFPIAVWFHRSLNNISVTKHNREVIWIIVTFIVTAFAIGMDRGDADRHSTYDTVLPNNFRCEEFVVLRSAASRFIAVGKNQRRYVIDDKCKVTFEFPTTWVFLDPLAKASITPLNPAPSGR